MVGDVLAERYELEKLVGSGGMSSVYRAHDQVLDRKVALKVLHQRLTSEEEYVERFRREALMVAGLLHQNIVTVIDRGEDAGCPFIVFEFVAGENLKELVNREGPLPIDRAVELAVQIARGLAFAHSNGYVHRDVKPQNVLLNGDGEAKVTDFGIARSLDVKRGVTQTGTVLGTSDYIAPEQAQGQQVDEHTDVYSLGIVLYELLTGELPFSGESFVAVAMQHINDLPPRVSDKRPEVPPRLDAAVARALAKRPEDRFATMADLGRELEACLYEIRSPGGAPTMVIAPPAAGRARPGVLHRRRRGRRPMSALLVAIGLAVAVAALAIALVREKGSSSGPSTASGGAPIALSGVGAYDPPPGDGQEHNDEAANATDTSPSTYWETQHYDSSLASLGKRGVGLVLGAGRSVTLHHVTVTTDTPGFTAELEAGDSATGPFHPVSDLQTVNGRTTFDLRDARGSYFVVWITNLGPLSSAHVNNVSAS
jgi:tRNA A-37 threonylcarbamoyl transferase component Bud32